ncbi:MAG: MFS transporter [Nocardioides sp.]|uniref:MFS transporter n=1 Tax=Nocardioides sp. TaxID=35761 RepID=UPI0023A379C0|nr:MFS transporter [Nocardioides sp.]MDE0778455.1 MFS transporter [Nocardioides sp.]
MSQAVTSSTSSSAAAPSGSSGPSGSGARPAQAWAYPLVITLLAVSLGVSGAPAPLYGLYEERWGLAPLTTTLVFAAYAFAALGAVLMAGRASDKYGRKPLLVGAALTMLLGLVIFMTAQGVAALFVARTLHGAAVGTAVVAGSAALLDLRPHDGARTGQLTGIMFNVGMAATILSAAVLADLGPAPFVTPYAVVGAVVLVLLVGVLAMKEPHAARTGSAGGRLRISRPQVPSEIAVDFRFSVLGVMASWSVLGVYLSLFPTFAGVSTGIDSIIFGGAVVATTAAAAAVSQAVFARIEARRAAITGDFGMAITLGLSVLALDSGRAWEVCAVAVLMGLTFGLAFGGSLRHLGHVVPSDHRGSVMSAYYVLAYGAMAVPTIVAGWAATTWSLEQVFPWFSLAVILACLAAGVLGLRTSSPRVVRDDEVTPGPLTA